MNWEEQPHLFNGFSVIDAEREESKIIGVKDNTLIVWFDDFGEAERTPNLCQLIARPKSDMSDEESDLREAYGVLDELGHFICDTPESFIYMLSIRVYPFEDTTNVIFRSKND